MNVTLSASGASVALSAQRHRCAAPCHLLFFCVCVCVEWFLRGFAPSRCSTPRCPYFLPSGHLRFTFLSYFTLSFRSTNLGACPTFFLPAAFSLNPPLSVVAFPSKFISLKAKLSGFRQLRRLAFLLDRSHNLTPSCLAGSCCVEVVVPRRINNSRRLSRRSSAQASRHPFHPSSPCRLSLFPLFSFISQKSQLRLTFDHPPWEPFAADKSRVSSLLCDNSAAEKGHVFPANRAVCASKYVVRRRRKPHLSSIHNCKIAPHLLIIAFFRFKGTAFQKKPPRVV